MNHNYFSTIDSEVKAYLLGFITADGCINDTRKTPILQVDISIKDVEIIKLLENEIGNTTKTYYSTNGQRVSYRTTSYQLCADLAKYGVVPRKSGKEQLCIYNLDKRLVRHYIRGLIYGDGWICTVKTPYGIKGDIGYYGGVDSCTQLRNYINQEICAYNVKVSKVKGKDNYKINYKGHNDIRNMLNYLYYDSTVHLSRKYEEAVK